VQRGQQFQHPPTDSANKREGGQWRAQEELSRRVGGGLPVLQQLKAEMSHVYQPRDAVTKHKLRQVITESTGYERESQALRYEQQQAANGQKYANRGVYADASKKIHFSLREQNNQRDACAGVRGLQIIEPPLPQPQRVFESYAMPVAPNNHASGNNTTKRAFANKNAQSNTNKANLYKSTNRFINPPHASDQRPALKQNENALKPLNRVTNSSHEQRTSKYSKGDQRLLCALAKGSVSPLLLNASTPSTEGVISCSTYYAEIGESVRAGALASREPHNTRTLSSLQAVDAHLVFKPLASGKAALEGIDAYIKRVQKALKRKTKNDLQNIRKGNVFDHLGEWNDVDPRDPALRVEVYDREAIRRMMSATGVQKSKPL